MNPGVARTARPLAAAAGALLSALLLAGCGHLRPAGFAREGPPFEPMSFFTGRTQSWGVFEDRTGAQPTRSFRTDCIGRPERGGLVLDQTFTYGDGTVQHRHWHIRRLDAHRYEATANDTVGTGRGEAYGNAFHWEYTVALRPGNSLYNVRLEQWMYLQPGGRTMLNRGTVSKFGFTIAQVAEEFQRLPLEGASTAAEKIPAPVQSTGPGDTPAASAALVSQ